MRSMNDEFDRALGAAGVASTGPRGMPRVGVTARITPPSITTKSELLVGQSRISIEPTGKQRVDVGYADRFGELVGASPKMRR